MQRYHMQQNLNFCNIGCDYVIVMARNLYGWCKAHAGQHNDKPNITII